MAPRDFMGHLSPPASALAGLGPEALYDRLGPEGKWREHVDGRHQHLGPDVYTAGLHGRDPDPRYNEAMMEADRHVRSTIGRPFDAVDYHRTHTLALPDPDDWGSHFRHGELPIRFAGFHGDPAALAAENTSPARGVPPLVRAFEPDSVRDERRGAHVVLADVTQERNRATGRSDRDETVYPRAIQGILDNYYQGRASQRTPDDMLRHVAQTHRSLENLHPYVDANTRTNRLVLNRLLVENRLPPAILHSPLDVHHHTLDSWTEQIRQGQQAWSAHAERGGDPTEAWRRHDRMEELTRHIRRIGRPGGGGAARAPGPGPTASAAAAAAAPAAARSGLGPAPDLGDLEALLGLPVPGSSSSASAIATATPATASATATATPATAHAAAGPTDDELEERLKKLMG